MSVQIIPGEQLGQYVAAEPANLMLYGPPGTEKTTDAVKAFVRGNRCMAIYAQCDPGGLKAPAARGLPLPDSTPTLITSYEDLVGVCQFAAQHKDRYLGVIVDTLSAWNESVVRSIDAMKLRNKYEGWAAIRDMLYSLRAGCRALGLHIIYIAHDMNPSVDDKGVFWPGAPLMQPKTGIKSFVGGVDTILRVGRTQTGQRVYYTGGPEWPTGVGLQPPDMYSWYAKNRDGVAEAVVPADLHAYMSRRKPPYPGF